MTVTLSKGSNTKLVDRGDVEGGRFQAVVRWFDPTGRADLDVSVLLLGADGRVRSDDDLVFYNAPTGGAGAVRLLGKRRDDEGNGEDRIAVDLEILPDDVTSLVVAASLDAAPELGFAALSSLRLAVVDAAGNDLVQYEVTDSSTETAFVLGELYARGSEWKCRAVGQGWESGLAGLATDYGITVDDRPDPDPSPAEGAGTADSEEATPIEALPVVADPVADPPIERPAGSRSAGTETSKRQSTGVRTGKKRPAPNVRSAVSLAGDPSWQAARPFSIAGTGGAQEQEKRATSALLATMMGVRDFGRGLVGRFGGPSGVVEAYLEVPFVLGERTVYPDGVLRVARGGRVWTALVETKTGSNPLQREQVENYLAVGKANEFDAVVTLSNDLCSVGGDHPVSVDRRKIGKVTLHHISWSEVLHEARMQLDHRGIEDRAQAWVLSELVRYLEDTRSGAAGFDDMGPAWVPIREAIAVGTVRASDKRIGDVAASWDKLIRHLCLRLTGQLGVTVAPVLPRKLAADAAARHQSVIAALATEGRLSATIRIPKAIGSLTVIADVRVGQVRASVEIDAPREGGATRRVNWLLRQLKEAPDSLSVEVVVARQAQTECELLKDVRVSSAALLPDPSVDVRGFRLTLSSPLGTKRSGLRGAFIPSVNAAVDAFYAQVIQPLRPFPSAAAKLPAGVAEEAAETIDALDEDRQDEAGPAAAVD